MGTEPLLDKGASAAAFAWSSGCSSRCLVPRALACLVLAFAFGPPLDAPFALALLEKGVCRPVLIGGVQWRLVVGVADAAGHALVEGRHLRAVVG